MNKPALLFSSLALSALCTSAAWSEVSVVTSIKPIHSLVAAVMEGTGTPDLILEGSESPHSYSLKPSQASKLENADVVFWVGPQIETFLERSIETIAHDAKSIELMQTPELVLLKIRSDAAFEAHDHGAHGAEDHHDEKHEDHASHEKHDDHAKHEEEHADHGHDDEKHEDHASHEKHDDHAKHEEKHADHGHDDEKHEDHADHEKHDDHAKHEEEHADHGHDDEKHEEHAGHDQHSNEAGDYNAHIWLDPQNAKILTGKIKDTLVELDPENASRYEENAAAATEKLDDLIENIQKEVASVREKQFIVFHDAYPYFENRFGVSAAGSITVNPEVAPGAERIGAIKSKVKELGATCVFAEPQFEPKLVSVILEGTDAHSGTLDPLGAQLVSGPELYPDLIREMARSMKECLSE
ncbi:MAG: zinc ABC transporter substrate-binding protein [Stappiaceae bacterium]